MIAPLAITLALTFWAPYNGGQPVCSNGVHIVYEQPGPDVTTAWVEPQDMAARDCRFHIRTDIADQRIEYQCMIVTHELGHAAMGLPDVTTGGIMDGPLAIPGACYPPSKQHLNQMAPARLQPPGARHRRGIFDVGQAYSATRSHRRVPGSSRYR